ncbi:hypothetical protein PSACC_00833 [Paramicrosporidium saccamoebae]|uniref:DNA-directed RNA polymerase III subunit n=1 Tax=Paramicrosporidium saccamoebae TaxID=1246581 RepID=A0A2H9TNL1_9FUNG|nr:hypothetical protein PSACC_00833 [Paramicrosporidium saccamoebae]
MTGPAGMSGRGRGRGRGKTVAPPSVANAPGFAVPIPAVTNLTVPKDPSEGDQAALRFSEELSHFARTSPYHLVEKVVITDNKIDRYSDKYVAHLRPKDQKGSIHAIVTEELYSVYHPERSQKPSRTQSRSSSFLDTLAKLKDLEKADDEKLKSQDQDGDTDEDGDEVVYEEEELEDETDYNLTYFDNDDEYGDNDDGDGIHKYCIHICRGACVLIE